VSVVEVKDVQLPDPMQRAMAKQAEAEREKRAKVIHAQGEFQAAETLRQAAKIISIEPAALQLRYLQTLTEIAGEKNSTIIPISLDIANGISAIGRKVGAPGCLRMTSRLLKDAPAYRQAGICYVFRPLRGVPIPRRAGLIRRDGTPHSSPCQARAGLLRGTS